MFLFPGKNRPPNIIFILADDLGYNDVGFRNPDIITPNIDKLARKGVVMTNSYSTHVCTPSRHALMTGRYPYKTGMQNFVIPGDAPVCSGLEYKFLPQYLKSLGYNTHAVGKWHLGDCRDECLPTERGFDSFYGLLLGGGGYWNHTYTLFGAYDWFNNKDLDLSANGTHSQDLMVDRLSAVFASHNREEPMFLYFAPQNPHTPSEATENFLRHYPSSMYTEIRRQYLGLVSGLDWMVGELLELVIANNMLDNTYIIFQSDNGGDAVEALNGPYRGGKGSLFEGGSKVVNFIYSPLLKKVGYENNGWMHITDWMPTIISLAGGEVPLVEGIDGINQMSMVLKGAESKRTSMVYNIDRDFDIRIPVTGEIGVR
ncbi:hypothetical protein CAPTEDRAFT_125641 [Capitella teleta]|uniref:Sulfatase N-terminal domain-containing protein n=1 Tax=Capitella teleta TaxID=283909 RepID=R7UBN7_CAPTE|nr:hypothetical protein CAPTEDRAFT_125641 [Capitella teleta]|eukprot:ELU00682.1 hypothetical protein CAPTEDRAFT_125641 [Capitella teleta]